MPFFVYKKNNRPACYSDTIFRTGKYDKFLSLEKKLIADDYRNFEYDF